MDLLQVRIKAFGLELLSVALSGVLGYLASPDFAGLVNAHFGESAIGALLLLVVTGIVKHIRNKRVLKKLGARGDSPIIV